jgi:hypothetical protein
VLAVREAVAPQLDNARGGGATRCLSRACRHGVPRAFIESGGTPSRWYAQRSPRNQLAALVKRLLDSLGTFVGLAELELGGAESA